MSTTPQPVRRWRDLRLSTRLTLLATLLVAMVGGMELMARVYWTVARKVPPFGTAKIGETFFPENQACGLTQAEAGDPEHFRVLVLGGSVWDAAYGDLGPRLEAGLASKLRRPVKVFACAAPGRTTLDSLIKYRKLEGVDFDLVLVYHAINDLHFNNCPRAEYRDDYTHAPRFWQLQLLHRHPEHPYFVLPYTLRFLASRWAEQLHIHRGPTRDKIAHGREIKTEKAFRANIGEIVRLASRRNHPIVLMTFATYIPADYTEEAFEAKRLDYDKHIHPLKMWGEVGTVPVTLARHNAVIRDLARETSTGLIDVAAKMPNGKRHYNDCCHLTPGGCEELIRIVLAGLDGTRLVQAREGGR